MTNQDRAEPLEATIQQIAEERLEESEIRSLVRELGSHLGVDALELDEDGMGSLGADDAVVLLSRQAGFPGITASVLLPNEPTARPLIYRRLLQANLSWADTGGGAFFLLPGDDTLILARRISLAHRNPERAASELSDLIELGRHWITEIEMFSDLFDEVPEGEDAGEVPPASGPGLIRA